MNYIRKFKKNSKALSPVVASIILIAVTVAVSVVVAAWMGGMTIGLMGSTEQASITNIQFLPAGTGNPDEIVALVQNSGSNTVTISTAFINGASATIVNATAQILKSSSGAIVLDVPSSLGALSADQGTSFAVKLVTAKGTQLSTTQTYAPY